MMEANIAQPLDGISFQMVRQVKPSPWLSLDPCGIRIDVQTGEVVIPDGLQLTDAARAFWAAVQHVSGYREPGFW